MDIKKGRFKIAAYRAKMAMEARRFTIAKMLSQNGNKFRVTDAAKALNVSYGTVLKDVYSLMENWREERVALVEFDRQRMAHHLEDLMKECRDRLDKLKHNPHQGSRWVEMEIKAIDRLCRLYGLYAPNQVQVTDGTLISKEDRDSVVDAILKAESFKKRLVNVTPSKP